MPRIRYMRLRMLFLISILAAFGNTPDLGDLVIDAKIPTKVLVDGQPYVQSYAPTQMRLRVPTGKRMLTIFTNGDPSILEVTIPEEGQAWLIISSHGTSLSAQAPETAPVIKEIPVEFQVMGPNPIMAILDEKRIILHPGKATTLTLFSGQHPLQVRNHEGTVLWANGHLHIGQAPPVLVQLTPGVVPEVTGLASTFKPNAF